MNNTIIETKDLIKKFPVADGDDFIALDQINIAIPAAGLTLLKGRSGSGKTTLLNILSALDTPTEGEVFFNGEDIGKKTEAEREKIRRFQVGYIFQSVALIPMMNAYENVEFALRLSNYKGNRKDRIEDCLRKVGLHERMYHMPREMSGGEQQRVAIARALAHEPKVIFADEPTAELDTNTSLQVVKVFKDLIEKEQIAIIMTTHDTGLMDIGDVCYEMEDGKIVGTYDRV
jgi:putative ABC transport system ATP-binding protein